MASPVREMSLSVVLDARERPLMPCSKKRARLLLQRAVQDVSWRYRTVVHHADGHSYQQQRRARLLPTAKAEDVRRARAR